MPDFQISGQYLIKENCHTLGTSNDIDTKLGSITKLQRRNTPTSKKIEDDLMAVNYDFIAIFAIRGQYRPIRKLDSSRQAYNTYIFINSNPISTKTQTRTRETLTQLYYFWLKMLIRGGFGIKSIFNETKFVFVLTYEMSSF